MNIVQNIVPTVAIICNDNNLKSMGFYLKEARLKVDYYAIESQRFELSKRYDVYIVELNLLPNDGIEVCEAIKTNFPSSVVLIVSNDDLEFVQIEAYKAGADDFISPDIHAKLLYKKIIALSRRKKPTSKTLPERVGNNTIKVNRESYLIEKDNQKIALQKKQFELLYLLISQPKRVFTRDELYQKVWENTESNNPRIIDVHIRKIREKIGENIIKTIKGRGYRFAE